VGVSFKLNIINRVFRALLSSGFTSASVTARHCTRALGGGGGGALGR
jgi:hypothetical protein